MAKKKGSKASSLDQIPGLTALESRFLHHYIQTGNGTLSAFRAGYAPAAAKQTACKILQRPEFQAALDRARQALAVEAGLTAKDIIAELKKVAFSNQMDYMGLDPNGLPITDLSTLTREQAAALSEVSTDHTETGVKVKIKTHNKIDALVNLGKMFGLFSEKHEHSGPDGGPIPIAQRYVVRLVPCPKPTTQPASLTNQ